jgi:lysophospholipase L1-like esterase
MTALKPILRNEAARIVALLIALIGAKAVLLGYADVVTPLPWPTGSVREWSDNFVRTLSSRDLNKEAREELTAGYYEGLINEGSRLSGMNRLLSDRRVARFEDNAAPDRRKTGDFLFYELIPNADIQDYSDERAKYRLRTNSAGFADREYPIDKPAGIRRIAVMGDSITRGQGAPFGGTFEALLEGALNERVKASGGAGVEILNFAVGSYNITQQMEMARTRAVAYKPDVYVYCLSPLSVYRSWARHLALVVNAGIDLKYDYLRKIVKEAGVGIEEPRSVFDAKMARFRLPTLRWALSEMHAHSQREGAAMFVVLVPTVGDEDQMSGSFVGVDDILQELGVPFVSLLDTFEGLSEPNAYRVGENDHHPNADGHKRLFEQLQNKLDADPKLLASLVGANGSR